MRDTEREDTQFMTRVVVKSWLARTNARISLAAAMEFCVTKAATTVDPRMLVQGNDSVVEITRTLGGDVGWIQIGHDPQRQ